MRAFITGVTGQDGSYLAEFLLRKGYDVFGMVPHRNVQTYHNAEHLRHHACMQFVTGDMLDGSSLSRLIEQIKPAEVYNLAAQSYVGKSWDIPLITADVTGMGFLRLLEACRQHAPDAKIYQASSSEMFGNAPAPQNEATPLCPASPYAAAKVFAHTMARVYRESHDMFVACGILFNHESERRGEHFVTQKIAKAVVRIAHAHQQQLQLGNLNAKRDWGHAEDYVRAMWLMLQQDEPDDFVIGTGEAHTVQDFVTAAFELVECCAEDHVKIDRTLFRPTDVNHLCADPRKAHETLGWKAEITFHQLVARMVSRWSAHYAPRPC